MMNDGKATIGRCASFDDTAVMDGWPAGWWDDAEWCKAELAKHPACPLFEETGRTCKEHDPDGPGSCHCPRCNLLTALGTGKAGTMGKEKCIYGSVGINGQTHKVFWGLMPPPYPRLPKGWAWCLSPCQYMYAFAPDGSKRLVTGTDGEWPHCQLTMWKRAASSPPGKYWWDFEEKNPDRINCREAANHERRH